MSSEEDPAAPPLDADQELAGKQEVRLLVRRFEEQEAAYRASGYNETQVRREFIDPFFCALGWDVDNRTGRLEQYKDVVHEDALRVSGQVRAPDYGFRTDGVRRFFVEAKKPSVNVRDQPAAAFQLRRYAWSAKLDLSVVTDFDELAVYDTRVQPAPGDSASTARIFYARFDEYMDRWEEIWRLLARASVESGSIKRMVEGVGRRRAKQEVDAAFLSEIESWRAALAQGIAKQNADLTTRELNRVVQATIDRLVFLRICEDRGIEEYGQLELLAQRPGVYRRLCQLYRDADARYNSGLFHFHEESGRGEEPDEVSLRIEIDDKPLKKIIERLYYPKSPYEFSVLPADILGQVYEQFLGHVIRLDERHNASVETKPEVRKAGGVYYTPTGIVSQIVADTLGPLLREATPKRAAQLRVVDPACGSGSFLLGAYEHLLQWHLDWYSTHRPERHKRQIFEAQSGWALTGAEKRRILLANIFGVDIDAQAVEVTKLSLLLKVLEGESQETVNRQLRLLRERALPDLGKNIRSGNSLVNPEIYVQEKLATDEETEIRVNPFDWHEAFPDVFQGGGFDAVIGNPPWLMAGYYVEEIDYLRKHYQAATKKFDLYYLFIERATQIVRPEGRIGLIVPNKMFHTAAAAELRQMLGDGKWIRRIVDFRANQIFAGATNYSCILSLKRDAKEEPEYVRADAALEMGRAIEVPWSSLGREPWMFLDRPTRELFDKLGRECSPLASMTARFGTGVQTGADRIMLLDPKADATLELESQYLTPFLRGRDVRRYRMPEPSSLLVFPYERASEDKYAVRNEAELAEAPRVWALLRAHEADLRRRKWFGRDATELSGAWYGLMYLDAPSTFERTYLLTPSLADRANFALGSGAVFATGTAGVTSVVPDPSIPEAPLYLLGVLNSRLLSTYAVAGSPIFQGGFFKFSAPYLRDLPIKRINFGVPEEKALHDEIAALVQRRIEPYEPAGSGDGRNQALEDEIDEITFRLYGLSDEEIDLINALEEADPPKRPK
jgi:type I restriction-modification system DNA methylase subunit